MPDRGLLFFRTGAFLAEEGLVAIYKANFKAVMRKFSTTAIDKVVVDYLRVCWVQKRGKSVSCLPP